MSCCSWAQDRWHMEWHMNTPAIGGNWCILQCSRNPRAWRNATFCGNFYWRTPIIWGLEWGMRSQTQWTKSGPYALGTVALIWWFFRWGRFHHCTCTSYPHRCINPHDDLTFAFVCVCVCISSTPGGGTNTPGGAAGGLGKSKFKAVRWS